MDGRWRGRGRGPRPRAPAIEVEGPALGLADLGGRGADDRGETVRATTDRRGGRQSWATAQGPTPHNVRYRWKPVAATVTGRSTPVQGEFCNGNVLVCGTRS